MTSPAAMQVMTRPFRPTQNGLNLWVSSDRLDVSSVALWPDRSAKGNHLVQATGSLQPLLVRDGVNGLPVVRFDGTDDFMQVAFTLNQPSYVLSVLKLRTSLSPRYFWDGAAANDRMTAFQATGGGLRMYAGANGPTDNTVGTSAFRIISALYNGASSSLRLDGAVTTGDVGADNAGGFTLGNRKDGAQAGAIDVAEVLIYDRALSVGELRAIELYFSDKYKIALRGSV